jgi:hypothetical protein
VAAKPNGPPASTIPTWTYSVVGTGGFWNQGPTSWRAPAASVASTMIASSVGTSTPPRIGSDSSANPARLSGGVRVGIRSYRSSTAAERVLSFTLWWRSTWRFESCCSNVR